MRTQPRFYPGAHKFRPANERERFQAKFPNMVLEAEADEFGYGSEYETKAMSSCPSFTPVAVEMPGGGRIKDKRIPDSGDLVIIQGAFAETRLHRLAAEALNALVCAARADGIEPRLLLPTGSLSGFRSPKVQASLRRSSEAMHGSQDLGKWVALPGFSAHQSGRAIDFYLGIKNDRRNVTKLRQTSAYKWMVANAQRFGFYPLPIEPWHWEYNPPASRQPETFSEMDESFQSSSTRTPWRCENTSLGETLCVNISPGINRAPNKVDKNGNPTPDAKFFKVEPMTGIFIPQAYIHKREVDIVLYLHGHKTLSPGSGASIGDYWNGSKFPYFALREEVNDSGQNVIFVAPTLGPLSQAGNLTTAKGFDNYLTQVLAALNEHFVRKNPQQEVTGIGTIILAAHSGGGSPMLRIAELKGSSNTSKIVECWSFDSVYGEVEKRWTDWAASHQNAKLFVYAYSTASRSKTLERISRQRNLQNVCVHGWTTKDFTDWARSRPVLKQSNVSPHFWVPAVYLKERLQNSPCRATQTQSEIPVQFRRTPTNSSWKFHGGITPHYNLSAKR